MPERLTATKILPEKKLRHGFIICARCGIGPISARAGRILCQDCKPYTSEYQETDE